jgi:MoaA/NifB/PqqE/SkfB family radical SAM enzyme
MTSVWIRLARRAYRTSLPLLLFYPTSRCNSRCVTCDWWKADGKDDLTLEEIAELTRSLPELGTRVVALTGGEPLLRTDLFEIADLFGLQQVRLELLTSGVLLHRHARDVAKAFSRVTISLDATSEHIYRSIRGIDALRRVEDGVGRLREVAPALPIGARATLTKGNFRELPALVGKARDMGLTSISFLAADVSTSAFGRRAPVNGGGITLDRKDVVELRRLIEATIESEQQAFASGFVAQAPSSLRKLPDYYAALQGDGEFPKVACNAPWVSAVVEANGDVRPCFFHEPVGNVCATPLPVILRTKMAAFCDALDVDTDPVCRRCVCSLRVGPRSALWQ